jgi:branched-chain amino acid aminotransferase
MSAAAVVWVNGRLEKAGEASLSISDRGFQLGDGVFETLRVVGGIVLELEAHMSRLSDSAAALAIALPRDLEMVLARAIAQVCAANALDGPGAQAAIRVTASRGPVEGRALLPPADASPTLVVQAWPVEPPPQSVLERGLRLVISSVRRDPASPLARVKTTSRAEFVYARLEANRRGADDALFLTTGGYLAEATSASLFLVGSSGLATPSLECGILASTTRAWVLSSGAPRLGLAFREDRLSPDDLFAADEVFLASSVAGIVPVTLVEARPIGTGAPGACTRRLRALREGFAVQSS